MAEMICQLPEPILSSEGAVWIIQVWAESNEQWHGWLVVIAADGRILRTGRETSHPNRSALRLWATGLRSVDLDDALARAFPPSAARPAA